MILTGRTGPGGPDRVEWIRCSETLDGPLLDPEVWGLSFFVDYTRRWSSMSSQRGSKPGGRFFRKSWGWLGPGSDGLGRTGLGFILGPGSGSPSRSPGTLPFRGLSSQRERLVRVLFGLDFRKGRRCQMKDKRSDEFELGRILLAVPLRDTSAVGCVRAQH